jgi:hypothetical protein
MLADDLPSPRQRVTSLDGSWAFWPDLEKRLPADPGAPFLPVDVRDRVLGEPRRATVPSPWQALFADLRQWAGSAWYETKFDVEEARKDRRIRLCFGAVDYFCSVWVNGREAGEHEGGYLPFALDVTDLVRSGVANALTVRVLDVGPGEDGPFPFAEIPHGKQSWYGPIGGIWQSTWIEARGEDLIEGAVVRADPATGGVHVDVRGPGSIRYRVIDPTGSEMVSGRADDTAFETRIAEAIPWHPDRPALFTLQLASRDDRWSTTFGFREIGTRDGMVTLNGTPVFLVGALDQDYWYGTIATPPSEDEVEREMRLARELGLNLLRCHIKPPAPLYLDAADRAGLLVWCEPPSWGSLTPDAERRVRGTIAGMVQRDANHPSVIAWSIVNEGWGTDLVGEADHRGWMSETISWAKQLDPSRLWVDNSACPPTFHVRSDLNDFHLYRTVPDQLGSWQAWTSGWAADPGRTYHPDGDVSPSVRGPQVLSEFGIWGLPDTTNLLDGAGRQPWWFDTGGDTEDAIVRPAGIRARFDAWGLSEVFGSWEGFVRESQEHQFEGLKAEIGDLRLHPQIAGYVITELTDVHWESNGLLDLRRNPKAFHGRFARMNNQVVVIGHAEHTRYRSSERAVIHVVVASPSPLTDPHVDWTIPELELSGTVIPPAPITFDVPAIHAPVAATVSFQLRSSGGPEPSRNDTRLWLYPERPTTRSDGVVIARTWREVKDRVERGGRAIVIADDDDALPHGGTIELERWDPDDDATGWFRSAGLGWLHPRLTEDLAIGPRVDLAFLGITPEHRIRGYVPGNRGDVFAGHYLGWIQDVTASVAAFRHGRGMGIVCTFPLLETDGRDPVATALLDRLVALVATDTFAAQTVL